MGLTDDDVREILRIVDDAQLDELRIDMPGFQLHVRRGAGPPPAHDVPVAAARREAPAAPPEPAAAPPESPNGVATIDAPMLGTFYRASAPGAEPYVDVGARVAADTTVCLIEVMKMMNSVKAGVAGVVVEVCAENAALVEYGAPLFRIDPAA